MPAFPNVPNVPGVPPLLRNPNAGRAAVSLLVNQAIRFLVSPFSAQWGIYKGGVPVIVAENVASLEYRQDWRVSDYPVEEGAFESYDKVAIPYDARVRFSSGGSTEDRQDLLDSVAAISGDLELYDVVTPEAVYQNCNVTHYDYRRTASNGVGLLTVDVWLVEVRVSSATTFSNTKSPSAAGTKHNGTVQPQPATQAQTDAIPDVE